MINNSYDAIIIGAGHNGLVTAGRLAQAGKKVIVLEKREILGGTAATEELFPGFKFNAAVDDAGLFQDEVVQKLFLKMHGLEFRESPVLFFAPQPDGRSLTLWRDEAKTQAEITRFSQRDAERFSAFVRQVNQMAQVLQNMMLITPPDIMERDLSDAWSWSRVGLKVRQLGKQDMMEFLRILPMAVSEYLDEWFESDALKGVLGAAGITSTMLGPRAAGTTLLMLYHHNRGFGNGRFVQGGTGQLVASLVNAAQQKGAEIYPRTAVSRILVEEGHAVGVLLADGREIRANIVISNADPRNTFFNLIDGPNLEPRFIRQVGSIIYRGCVARMHLALSGLPHFTGQREEAQLSGRIRISPSLHYLEKAYDDAKYGRFSHNPYLDITIPSVLDPALAPDGRHVMSITMQYAPYDLRENHWDEQRKALAETILDTVDHYAPNLKELILRQQLITPLDWERDYGVTEGNLYHGQMSLDQLLVMRPVAGWSQYRTPIDNLYLCGSGTHPGGGLTGAPGYNAAREILQKLK